MIYTYFTIFVNLFAAIFCIITAIRSAIVTKSVKGVVLLSSLAALNMLVVILNIKII